MDDAPKEILENACRYLRKEYGRPETEFARRILTVASKCIGTDNTVVLTGPQGRYIERASNYRVDKQVPLYAGRVGWYSRFRTGSTGRDSVPTKGTVWDRRRRDGKKVSNNPLTNNGKCGNMEAGEL